MNKSPQSFLLSLSTALGLATAAHADLLSSFDTGLGGSDGAMFVSGSYTWDSIYQAVQYNGTVGGSNVITSGPKWEFASPARNSVDAIASSGHGRLSFDLILSADYSFLFGNWQEGDWYQLHFIFDSGGTYDWTVDPVYGPYPAANIYHTSDPDLVYHFDFAFADVGWEPGDV